MRSFDEHVKKFNLDDEEREILADYEANHQGKPQITKERKKELAALAGTAFKIVCIRVRFKLSRLLQTVLADITRRLLMMSLWNSLRN